MSNLSRRLGDSSGPEWDQQMKAALDDKEKMVFTGFVAREVEKAANEAEFAYRYSPGRK